jgi:hypothetical protein
MVSRIRAISSYDSRELSLQLSKRIVLLSTNTAAAARQHAREDEHERFRVSDEEIIERDELLHPG